MNNTNSAAEADYAVRVKMTLALMGKNNKGSDVMLARQLGRNILLEDIDALEDPLRAVSPYEFDSGVKDRLAAHTREDVAMIYSLAVRANEQLYEIRSLLRILVALSVGIIVLSLFAVIGG